MPLHVQFKNAVFLLSQTGTDTPVMNMLNNTIGDFIITRAGVGNYYVDAVGSMDIFPNTKTFLPLFGNFDGSGVGVLPITNFTTIVGYWQIGMVNDHRLNINMVNASLIPEDLSVVMGASSIAIEIRVYP